MESVKTYHFSFVLIGSGNLAFSLGKALVEVGHKAFGVVSTNQNSAKELAEILNTKSFQTLPSELTPDFVFLCVPDNQVAIVSQNLKNSKAIVCHCSGATDLKIVSEWSDKAGVFYPFQSFSKHSTYNWKDIPILIEATDKEVFSKIELLAQSLSHKVMPCDSLKRSYYHLSAVFANNFTNHIIALAQEICLQKGLDSSLLLPLLKITFENAVQQHSKSLQTGPAIRNDEVTLAKHLKLLEENKEVKEVYELLTASIQRFK